jgi:hypothetical protein
MKTDIKDFLTRSTIKRISDFGKPVLNSLLSDSHHSSARILTVHVPKQDNDHVLVLKQIKLLQSPIFAKYLLKNGQECPEVVAGHSKSDICKITDEDPKYIQKRLEQLKKLELEKVSIVQVQEKAETQPPEGYSYVYVPFEYCTKKMEFFTDGADTLLECSEFLVESSVDYLIKHHVQPKIPFFLTNLDSWRSRRHGNILLNIAGFDVNSYISFYNLLQIQAIVLQTMYAISWAQKYISLKHHDLHCGNVFIDGEIKEAMELKFPNGDVYCVPSKMPKILIADYGLSSATDPSTKCRVTRADFHLMETSRSNNSKSTSGHIKNSKKSDHSDTLKSQNNTDDTEEDDIKMYRSYDSNDSYDDSSDSYDSFDTYEHGSESSSIDMNHYYDHDSENDDECMDLEDDTSTNESDWGEWTNELNPNNSKRHVGYDIACFISNLQEEAVDRKHESLIWLNNAIEMMKELDSDFQLTRRGRPLTSTKFTIEKLAELIEFDEMFKKIKPLNSNTSTSKNSNTKQNTVSKPKKTVSK